MSASVEYQLGFFIGEYIVGNFLPNLSIYGFNVSNIIKVSTEDTQEYEQYHDLWWNEVKYTDDKSVGKKEWNDLQLCMRKIDEKYYPHILDCYIPKIRVSEDKMNDLKLGIRRALWDCDRCSYKCDPEDIMIEEEEFFTKISFPLNLEPNLL